ncbi:hypothetical protein [Streptomyces atratus]|uniref:hypothetical protein n=1 Tax=Streptomyces atratus TaxID=1893 RepID=UPI0022598E06|nr:hypothetical protein [Streptomyces atratus]MCX5345940.1 hypothetical protein [Streptomyces atratus]
MHPDSSAEHVVFGVECQGGWTWSIPWEPGATDTDPTVWFEDSHPVPEQEPLSRFLLQFSLWEATIAAAYQASCDDLPRHLLPALNSCLQPVPLRPFLSPADAPTDFLVAPGLVAGVGPSWDDGKADIWIGAQHRSRSTGSASPGDASTGDGSPAGSGPAMRLLATGHVAAYLAVHFRFRLYADNARAAPHPADRRTAG